MCWMQIFKQIDSITFTNEFYLSPANRIAKSPIKNKSQKSDSFIIEYIFYDSVIFTC